MELKVKIREWVNQQNDPFKTSEVVDYARKQAPNIYTSGARIKNYIKEIQELKYDKNKKQWLRTQPNVHVNTGKETVKNTTNT